MVYFMVTVVHFIGTVVHFTGRVVHFIGTAVTVVHFIGTFHCYSGTFHCYSGTLGWSIRSCQLHIPIQKVRISTQHSLLRHGTCNLIHRFTCCVCRSIYIYLSVYVIGVSLSEPYTSRTALGNCICNIRACGHIL